MRSCIRKGGKRAAQGAGRRRWDARSAAAALPSGGGADGVADEAEGVDERNREIGVHGQLLTFTAQVTNPDVTVNEGAVTFYDGVPTTTPLPLLSLLL